MSVSLETAKLQLRVDHPDEDALIQTMIAAAARRIENYIGIPLVARDEKFSFDCFSSSGLELHLRPVNSVDNIAYVDQDGENQTLDAHRVVREKIYPLRGEHFPTALSPSEIVVTANVGYEEDDNPIPETILQAQLLLLSHYYTNREAVITGTIASDLPLGVADLLSEFRDEMA